MSLSRFLAKTLRNPMTAFAGRQPDHDLIGQRTASIGAIPSERGVGRFDGDVGFIVQEGDGGKFDHGIAVSRFALPRRGPSCTHPSDGRFGGHVGRRLLHQPEISRPFTVANPNERHPIAVRQGQVTLDLAAYPGASGLNELQMAKVVNFLADYKSQSSDCSLIRAPSGGPNETAAMRAYDQVRKALPTRRHRSAIGRTRAVFRQWRPIGARAAVLSTIRRRASRLPGSVRECRPRSPQHALAQHGLRHPAQSCGDGRQPRGLVHPRGETQRSGERRDVVWGKYVAGELTISKRAPSEHANASDVS